MGSISVEMIGKAYRQYPSRWSRLAEWVLPGGPRHELHWVLKDISFSVAPGESVGIIGVNGAGKSTLLKMIVGTTQPTTGRVQVSGRVAALLELGMGFHPDFTGRQNVWMAGQLLGYSADEIGRLMPQIEAFAEIGDYMDQPLRVYSSGMQMRLAFSVATASRPDILIVDEALSVGDSYFQHKSFQRIREFREQGTTLLIVSHDRGSIQSVCDRAILLDANRIIKDGAPEDVFDYYNAIIAEKQNSTIEVKTLADGRSQTRSGTGQASVIDIALCNSSGEAVECISVGERVELRVTVKVNDDIPTLVLGYGIKDRLGQVMYGTNTWHTGQVIEKPVTGDVYRFRIAFDANLGIGSYSVHTALVDRETHMTANYEWRDLILMFNVINVRTTMFAGSAWIEPKIAIEKAVSPHHATKALEH